MIKEPYKHARLQRRKFWAIVRAFSHDIAALTAAKMIRLNKNTTHDIYNRLRRRVVQETLQESAPFIGEVEVDESYFGARRVRGKRGRGARGKVPVIGLLKRDGKVYVKIVPNCCRQELMPILKGRVKTGSPIYTDGWKAYDGLIFNGYEHYRVHHANNEFSRGKKHINGIESFWSFAKIRMAKQRGTRKEKFALHLKECEWRWNHRQ